MPDTLSLTAGVSLGLLAGIVSGVCYLVANGLTWQTTKEKKRRCITSSVQKDDAICLNCGGDKEGGAIPCICYTQHSAKFESGAWFLRQVQRATTLMPWSLSTDKLEQIDEECDGRESPGRGPSPERLQHQATVREFLETLSAKLAGGPIEGTRIAPLYDHPAYLPPTRDASPSASSGRPSSGASSAHVQLKRLVARVVEEAAALPALARYASEPHTPTIESSTYEDLLASAILNKISACYRDNIQNTGWWTDERTLTPSSDRKEMVIERFQNENGSGGRSSGIHSASASPTPSERSSPRSLNSRHTRETRHIRDITPPLHEEDDVSDWEEGEATDEALETPRRVPFPEFGGDIVHHTDNGDPEFDDVSSSDLQGTDGTWEENWLFQKKKIKTIQSVPVPMLVPNSNAEYRALIGDRDADDTTDLSDNASDTEEQNEYKSDIKRVLDSKHVIGGKSKIEETLDFEPDSLTEDGADEFEKLVDIGYKNETAVDDIINEINDNKITVGTTNTSETDNVDKLLVGIDEGPLHKAEFNLKEEIHRTLMNGHVNEYPEDNSITNGEVFIDSIENITNNKESNNNTLNHHEREGEYEETVTIPVQRYADSLRRKHFDDSHIETQNYQEEQNKDDEEDLVPGSVAYRERKKWLNYVEMPNNPYSPEAIQKRLSAKSTSSLFDMITTKTQDLDDETPPDSVESNHVKRDQSENEKQDKLFAAKSVENIALNGGLQTSSPKMLKEVLAEEVPQFKRYGRDYYVKEAKASSGGRKKNSFSDTSSISSINKSTSLDNFDTEFTSPGLLIKQFNTIASNQQYTKFVGKDHVESITITPNHKTEIMIEYEDNYNEAALYSARPAIVDDETDKRFEEIIQSVYKTDITNDVDEKIDEPMKSPISVANSYISSSSLEDSIKIYNVQTGEVIKCRPEDNVSVRYETAADSSENIDVNDNNALRQNSDTISHHGDSDEEAVIIEEYSQEESKLESSELEDILPNLPKVKELAKKFVSMENINEPVKVTQPYSKRRRSKENVLNGINGERPANKQMYMHSLTARSISKEFRDELKLSMATPLKVPGGSKEIPEGEEVIKESSRPGSPLPEPGTIKTKLAFFESLKTKFSSK